MDIQEKLGKVIQYYIITRDTRTDLTYEQIKEKLEEIEKSKRKRADDDQEKWYENAYFTHSFPGYKADRIKKFGFSTEKLPKDEKERMQEMRGKLKKLEEVSKKRSPYADDSNGNVMFITTPGTKTIYYSCKGSPERLWFGLLHSTYESSIIVGEKLEDYALRVAVSNIKENYPGIKSKEFKEAVNLAKEVIHYYCSGMSAFALIAIKKLDLKVCAGKARLQQNSQTCLEDILNGNVEKLQFTERIDDSPEKYDMGDIAINAEDIPLEAIEGICNVLNFFELKQIWAKKNGSKIGDIIDYDTCLNTKDIPSIDELEKLVDNVNSIDDVDVLLQKMKGRIQLVRKMQQLIRYKLREKIDDESEIPDFVKEHDISLKKIFEGMEAKDNLISDILNRRTQIEKDELQYMSTTHGYRHTIRVNFFAECIMLLEEIDGRDREIILEIVKNHDIGRRNDFEDEEHGEKSVRKLISNPDRLEDFTKEEEDLIYFVIREHSKSSKDNEKALSELPPEIREKYRKILSVCKDADKLDRVRLSPDGNDLKEGLDETRLNLDSSKKLVKVAYQAYYNLFKILYSYERILNFDEELENEASCKSKIEQRRKKIRYMEVMDSYIRENVRIKRN